MPVNERKHVTEAVEAICNDYDYEPLEELIKIVKQKMPLYVDGVEQKDPQTGETIMVPLVGVDSAINIHKEILKYKMPQKRSVDIKADGQKGFVVVVNSLTQDLTEDVLEIEEKEVKQLPSTGNGSRK